MSVPSSWLQKQRKSDLVGLADQVGLKDYESLKKTDLEVALDEFLRANQSKFANESSLMPFYKRIAAGSPVKKESVAATPDSEPKSAKPRSRKIVKVRDNIDSSEHSTPEASRTAMVTRTPRTSLGFPSPVNLPPSPAAVADAIDRRTADVRSKIGKAWEGTGVTNSAEGLREVLSSAVGVETLVLLIEACGLFPEVLPLRYPFKIPAQPAIGLQSDLPVPIPDLFLLLTNSFWGPFTLWLSTTLLVPLAFAYFFNLTLHAKSSHATHSRVVKPTYRFDPLAFNVVKGLITWLVYSQGVGFGGWLRSENVARVDAAIPGGHTGILIGAGVGALASIYEAILKK
ncbi:hypothetical protein L228DRAFT_260174 [Xylona heveae TC161]|uniref:Uncharacterized protein n=1 Tax=Xylona heveae (strain CBS 132557 / TC161) TaxID=1328760 RepID=A0A165HD99_XYLHT|nr:hypothetical protein L228DRAFT_260174 [Xylona heveae TC161]KZF23333.1 hypothetical protein L228DRAFT_260174 [Xylona heveae TC161]